MIAVALSGGDDSTAAALILHEQGEEIMGITLLLDEGVPDRVHLESAAHLCRHLGVAHHVLDVRKKFSSIPAYFLREYLHGKTPNPCAVCNRDIKFRVFMKQASALGADAMATGHYAQKGTSQGRYYLMQAREANSQEYFLGLLSQEDLMHALFPLGEITRSQARELVKASGIPRSNIRPSQNVCFVPRGGYVPFVCSSTGHTPVPGRILDLEGRILGVHRGVIRYTPGQRKGLGTGFGRKVYVLSKEISDNTITVGNLDQWPYTGFRVTGLNYMKASVLESDASVFVKVRYRQNPVPARILSTDGGCIEVGYTGIVAPGQLAALYDAQNAILAAGIIETPVR
ncbi:MAG TPA: tRNA-specific 2-thiouridylase [Deltaproteobacteria bacterium]|nr:tRNA-specific 2-thiouridylase [Deltaproteobacteria bacterium]